MEESTAGTCFRQQESEFPGMGFPCPECLEAEMHDYYHYTIEEVQRASKGIKVRAEASSEAVFRAMAREMADTIILNNSKDSRTVYIVPVGPVGQYPYFVEIVNKEEIDLSKVWFFNMDEYLTDEKTYISKDSNLSFRGFMEREVYSRIRADLVMPESQRVFPDPSDPGYVTRKLEELGGADICFGGIGLNGHLAFNEAQGELTADQFSGLTTRVLPISTETRTSNAIGDLGGALEDMPKYAITVGIREILASRRIILGVFRTWHRAVVRRACCGEVSASFPATLLQNHGNAEIYVNDVASEKAY